MARVKGPLHSLDARGNFAGGTLQFRGGLHHTHAYRPAPPHTINQAPPSPAQSVIRDSYHAIHAQWLALSDDEKTQWDHAAQATGHPMSGWNLYLKTWMTSAETPPETLTTTDGQPLLTDQNEPLLLQ